jgi:hypothetical protein
MLMGLGKGMIGLLVRLRKEIIMNCVVEIVFRIV